MAPILNRKLFLEEETAVFILVNFADLILTGVAFYLGATEANPAANWVIRRFGLMGMSFYKFALVTAVILICQFIYPTHPKIARGILVAGSVGYAILMMYVLVKLFTHVIVTF